MSTLIPDFPDKICGILKDLAGEKVIIILESGDKELVKVVAVKGNILIATVDRKFKFVDCDCICAVIADCLDVISDRFQLHHS
ncbi:hypothetical protein SAMN05660649_01931 [Desulfotomaculum arcticum]|uniref:Uncharacterized protein n=1 Tax=Desulfotruncus arcticus DSM 17038 TaxID=1121424 RepID=A0A1I2SP70_9FIRM|nr:hypothetical protein [Desulfotruncus arcticus]SFG54530.1 hypothetical protein SAMN05660649_01931 [Desulfotomaculum arcticum] [Desulfotruncus arcticus DSM 17038]